MRRASPVASYILVSVPSLPPRWNILTFQPIFVSLSCLRPRLKSSASRVKGIEATYAFTCSLRPRYSLTILMMALSSGFKSSVSFPLTDLATRFWLLPWWVCLPLNVLAFPGHTCLSLIIYCPTTFCLKKTNNVLV